MSAPNQVSFLPDDYLDRKLQRRTNILCLVLTALVMGGIGTGFAISLQSINRIVQQQRGVDQSYADAAQRITQLRDLQSKQQRIAHQAEMSASLLEKVPRTLVLAQITNALPAGVSLLALTMESHRHVFPPTPLPIAQFGQPPSTAEPAKSPEQPVVFDVTLRLIGVAATDVQVAQFINHLSRSQLFNDVNLATSDDYQMNADKVRRFSIDMALAADVPRHNESRHDSDTAALELN
jgi:Tfp pilus assembly protein PilN